MSDFNYFSEVRRDARRADQVIEPALSAKQIAICHDVDTRTVSMWARSGEFSRWRELDSGHIEVPVSAYQAFVERQKRHRLSPAKRKGKLVPRISARQIAVLHGVQSRTVRVWAERGWFGELCKPDDDGEVEVPLDAYLAWCDKNEFEGFDDDKGLM